MEERKRKTDTNKKRHKHAEKGSKRKKNEV
jgi:hypothetical protein